MVLIFLVSTPASAGVKAEGDVLGKLGVQTGVCTARGFAQVCANSAQVALDVISVRILILEILSGTSVLFLGIYMAGFLGSCCLHFRERNFLARFLCRVIFVSLKTSDADAFLSQL